MKDILTYSLYGEENDSDRYYEDALKFTDKVIHKLTDEVQEIVDDFENFILKNDIEKVRSELEYKLELLILGVLWNCYINNSITLKKQPKNIILILNKLRRIKSLKKSVDFLRGTLSTIYLDNHSDSNVGMTKENLKALIYWLDASCEFKEQVKRLKNWIKYLDNKPEEDIKTLLSKLIALGKWFEKESKNNLGKYTKNVEVNSEKLKQNHKWKEDYILCSRKAVEYHLNMVGAEILNTAYRKDFLDTRNKMVLLPSCMSINKENCKSTNTKRCNICVHCNKLCNINKYVELGKKNGFKVYIIHHQSDAFKDEKIQTDKVGIIGVTCALNLIEGGLNAKELGFIPQCVLLDYSGCKQHWNKKGIPTTINHSRFKFIYN